MSDEILGVANLGEIDRLYRVYVNRNLVYVRLVGFSTREEITSGIPCPSSYRSFATIDFRDLVGERGVCPPRRLVVKFPRHVILDTRGYTRGDTQTSNKIGARRIQQRDESRLVDTRTRVKRSASRCVRPPFRKDTERFSTTYGSGA